MKRMIGKYKINLKDKNVFNDIEEEYDIRIPNGFKRFIIDNNAATPEKHRIIIGNQERVFGSVLSFNKDDDDNVFRYLKRFIPNNLLPFGLDPFGNIFCIDLKSGDVQFWNHEIDKTYSAHCNLSNFVSSLY